MDASRSHPERIRLGPIVAIGAQAGPPRKRELGLERGQIWISPDFDDPMPDAWLDEWER